MTFLEPHFEKVLQEKNDYGSHVEIRVSSVEFIVVFIVEFMNATMNTTMNSTNNDKGFKKKFLFHLDCYFF